MNLLQAGLRIADQSAGGYHDASSLGDMIFALGLAALGFQNRFVAAFALTRRLPNRTQEWGHEIPAGAELA
jgi:hypothetical protein